MNRQWYGRDRGLTTRMGLTMFGLGLLYVGFMTVIIALGAGAVAVTFFAGVVLLVQLLFSDRLALAGMRARVVSPDEAPELHAIVERLCQLADLPKPRLAIADTAVPNAFAAGRGRSASTVCVTTGLLERLDAEQLQGVLAHELSRIANRDVAVMTVASFMATVAGLLIRMGTYGRVGGKGNAAGGVPGAAGRKRRRVRGVVPAAAGAVAVPRVRGGPGRGHHDRRSQSAGLGAGGHLGGRWPVPRP